MSDLYDQMSDRDPERPLYPNAHVQLSGEDGNPFFIIARTRAALRRAGASPGETEAFFTEATLGDYDHLLQTVMDWVEVS